MPQKPIPQDSSLLTKLRQAIAVSGFPLEMRVARILARHGWH